MKRVAVVTGAARGIGAATAQQLSAEGWNVALVDICSDVDGLAYELATAEDLDAAVAACEGDAFGIVADARDQDALDAAIAQVVERFGGLDAAIGAAGAIAGGAPAWETTDEIWTAMVGLNLTGTWRLARATIPRLRSPGRFIAVASAAATVGLPQLAAYSAAKHGIAGLVKSMAVELGDSGITANAVCPGSTSTAMLDASAAVYGAAGPAEFVQHQPIGRLLDPEEIAAAILWLCSPASSGVTGALLPVDGGMTSS